MLPITTLAVLFIDEIHTVVGAGAQEGSMDARYSHPPASILLYIPYYLLTRFTR